MAGNFFGDCSCRFFNASVFNAGCTILLVSAFPDTQITLGAVYMHECPAAPVIPVFVMVCGILALLIMGLFAVMKLLCPAAQGNRIWILGTLTLLLFVFIWILFSSYQIYSVYPPKYTMIDPNSFNNTIFTPSEPDNRPGLSSENQNKSLPNLNHTWMFNPNNQILRNLIQTLSLSSRETNREHHHVMAPSSYCDRTVYLFAFWTTTLFSVLAGNALVITICVFCFIKIVHLITYLTKYDSISQTFNFYLLLQNKA